MLNLNYFCNFIILTAITPLSHCLGYLAFQISFVSLQVCPNTGNIVAVASVMVQADTVNDLASSTSSNSTTNQTSPTTLPTNNTGAKTRTTRSSVATQSSTNNLSGGTNHTFMIDGTIAGNASGWNDSNLGTYISSNFIWIINIGTLLIFITLT